MKLRFAPGFKDAEAFLYLQVLDFLTTVVGLELGLSEMSPFVRMLIERTEHPLMGVLFAKLAACGIGGYCILRRKDTFMKLVNFWFAALVVWNLAMLFWYARVFVRR